MNLKIYYRISDNSYPKAKLPGVDKESCLMNFCRVFSEDVFGFQTHADKVTSECIDSNLRIIADKCERKTNKMLLETGLSVAMTELGNAGSLRKAIEMAIEEGDDNDIVYFCEDDYLHRYPAPLLIREIADLTDYFTLYDHPDKYTAGYNHGEVSKVIKTKSSHWRFTKSTCMTFGAKVKTIKEDKDIWWKYTEEDHPHDHQIFEELNKKLAVCIPGVACHTDLTFSGAINNVLIDDWAIKIMISHMQEKLGVIPNVKNEDLWKELLMLDALRFHRESDRSVVNEQSNSFSGKI